MRLQAAVLSVCCAALHGELFHISSIPTLQREHAALSTSETVLKSSAICPVYKLLH